MNSPAIEVEGLGKRYRIGAAVNRHRTLRDALAARAHGTIHAVGRRMRGDFRRRAPETIWALKDVGFSVAHGETVGVIGSNGAGKSTLLKILSRITGPTTGFARIHGRVGSLLEVGTGFHPELSGRENTYLNGAILGMRRSEIDRKFDEIVAFAAVEKFIDTPVKHYSTGMQLRLAFAVAAHLEPEILIVDEVLAVGDANFQKKCLGKMDEVANEGRTVLFVSHDMDAISRLCDRCLLLRGGRVADEGATAGVISRYLSANHRETKPGEWVDLDSADRIGSGEVKFLKAVYGGEGSDHPSMPVSEGVFQVQLELYSDTPRSVPSIAVVIYTQDGLKLVNADSVIQGKTFWLDRGRNHIHLRIPTITLNAGAYLVGLWAAEATSHIYDFVQSAFEVRIGRPGESQYGQTPEAHGLIPCNFEMERVHNPTMRPMESSAIGRNHEGM